MGGYIAAIGLLEALVGGAEEKTKKILTELIRAAFPNLRFGPIDTAKAENFQGYNLSSTTGTSTSEFSVVHNMGRTPYRAMPAMDLSVVGSAIVPLEVTRAADATRMYFKTQAGSTSSVFSLYVE